MYASLTVSSSPLNMFQRSIIQSFDLNLLTEKQLQITKRVRLSDRVLESDFCEFYMINTEK